MIWALLDDSNEGLGPLGDLRPTWKIRTGGTTTGDRLVRMLGSPSFFMTMRKNLAAIVLQEGPMPEESPTYFVSGRWLGTTPPPRPDKGQMLIDSFGFVIAAYVKPSELISYFDKNISGIDCIEVPEAPMLRNPIDLLNGLPELLLKDLQGKNTEKFCNLHDSVSIDDSLGPIYLGPDVNIGHQVVLQGPLWIESGSKILSQSFIKSNTSIGPYCRVGGEVGGTVFQGFSNKSHGGHLGDSWVGEWVNIGAGTNNSNLLNTYGSVSIRVESDKARIRTDRNFVGCFLGDHVKLGIMTKIMTGTVVGTGAMVALSGTVPTTVDRFAWLTDQGIAKYRWEKFESVMRVVMSRRESIPDNNYVEIIKNLAARSNL